MKGLQKLSINNKNDFDVMNDLCNIPMRRELIFKEDKKNTLFKITKEKPKG